VQLLQDLKVWEDIENNTMYLRRRWVLGSAEWLAGMHGSKTNDKEILGYSDWEWEFIWSTMIEDGAWAVADIKDSEGNVVKQNHAHEMLIKFIAHDLKGRVQYKTIFYRKIACC
jgi:hypothetical protein